MKEVFNYFYYSNLFLIIAHGNLFNSEFVDKHMSVNITRKNDNTGEVCLKNNFIEEFSTHR